MNSLFDDVSGEEFRFGSDGRYYHSGVGYEVVEGDASPLEGGGKLVSTPPNTATLPTQGAGPGTITTGMTGNEHKMLAGRLVQEVAAGRTTASRVMERLINVTSPLQVNQQAVLDAFNEYYEESGNKSELDPFLEKYDADPLYTVDVLMSDIIHSPQVSEQAQNAARDIVTRYNLSVP